MLVGILFVSVVSGLPSEPLWCDYSAVSNTSDCIPWVVSESCYTPTNLSYGGVMGTHHPILEQEHPAMGAFADFAWPRVEVEARHSLEAIGKRAGIQSDAIAQLEPIARRTCNMTLLELRATFDGIAPFEGRYQTRQGIQTHPLFAGVTAFAQLRTAWASPASTESEGTMRVLVIDHTVAVTYDVSRSMSLTKHEWMPAEVAELRTGQDGIGGKEGGEGWPFPWVKQAIGDEWLPGTCPVGGRRLAREHLARIAEGVEAGAPGGLSAWEGAARFVLGLGVGIRELENQSTAVETATTEVSLCDEEARGGGVDAAERGERTEDEGSEGDIDEEARPQQNCASLVAVGLVDAGPILQSAVEATAGASLEVRADGSAAAVDGAPAVPFASMPLPPPLSTEGYPFTLGAGLNPPASASRPLRVVCYNAWNSNPPAWLVGNPRDRFQRYGERLDLLAAQVAPLSPDVVLVQEVRLDSSLGGPNEHGQMAHLAERFPGYQYVSQPAMLHHGMGREGPGAMGFGGGLGRRDEEGVGVLSRHPIVLSEYALLSRDVEDGDDGHQRAALHAVVDTGGGLLLDVYTVHMPLGVRARRRLARELHAFARASRRGHAVVVAGDMNAEPDEPCVQFWQGLGPPPPVPGLAPTIERRENEEEGEGRAEQEEGASGPGGSPSGEAPDARCDWGAVLGHDDAGSRSGFVDAWVLPQPAGGGLSGLSREGLELPGEWRPAGGVPGAGAVQVGPREVVLGWSEERVLRDALTFPSDNATKRIDFVFLAVPPAVSDDSEPPEERRLDSAWMRAGRACRGAQSDASGADCFQRPAIAVSAVTAAWVVGQDPKPGVGNLTAEGLGMVSPDSPMWASDHRGLVVDIEVKGW